MDDPAHRHRWRIYRRIDFCHYQQLCLQCECGAASQEIVKRDFANYAQRAFANPDCSTCRRLTAFEPTHSGPAL
jgi:hypothetical protein